MLKPEFDQFSASYEATLDTPALLALGGASSRDFIHLKCQALLDFLKAENLDPSLLTALDAGCGTGIAEEYLAPSFKRMIGVDLSSGMVEEAEKKKIPKAEFQVANAAQVSLADGSVDVAFYMCILHHAKPAELVAIFKEAQRLLKPGGWMVIFEHNRWNPATRYVVSQCPVDVGVELFSPVQLKNLVTKAGFQKVRTQFLIFFPRFLKFLLPLERFLGWCPVGGQFFVAGRRHDEKETLC